MFYFEERGDPSNPTVVLLPGAGEAHTFYHQYRFADRLHLVTAHYPGSGEESGRLFGLRETLDGILELVRSLGKDKVGLCGFSLGAQLTIPLLCEAEELFSKAIIVSAWILKPPEETAKLCRMTQRLAFLETWPPLLKWQAKKIGLPPKETADLLRQAKMGAGIIRENYARYCSDGVDIDQWPRFAQVQVPMLALVGEKETQGPMIPSAKRLGELNPNCKVEVWPNHAHDIPRSRPEEFGRVFEQWFCC